MSEPKRRKPARRVTFTTRGVAAIKAPTEGRVDVWDEDLPGFGLRLFASGVRTWMVRYRRGRKQRRLAIGDADRVSLADARKAARTALGSVDAGGDPAAPLRRERDAATFGELAALYLEKHASKKRSGFEDQRIIERELLPPWKNRGAHEVKRADVVALLDDIAAGRGNRRVKGRPAPIRANRVLAVARKMYNFGIQRGVVEANPCAVVARPSAERRRDRVLSEEELRGLWRGLDGEALRAGEWKLLDEQAESPEQSGAVRMLLLTAQRRSEVLRMRWQDVAEEAGASWWTIPPQYTKNGLTHRVPLVGAAVAILDGMRERKRSGPWVFAGRVKGAHLVNVESTIDRARERHAPPLAHFTPHDFRRTAASVMTGVGIPRLVVKKILNHADPDVTAVYDRHGYDAEKRQALEAWARRLDAIVSGTQRAANVVPHVRR